jgi:hypothetical protein
MPFSQDVKARMFARCDRYCCLCYKRCGVNIEAAHIVAEADGGPNTEVNGIPLCFDCHQETGSYDPRHPRGNKFTPDELRTRRDRVYRWVEEGRFIEAAMARDNSHRSDVTSNPVLERRDFTFDIGLDAPTAGVPKFIFGPLMLTHIGAEAVVRITKGHPADAEGDSPTVAILDGKSFRGEFFVDWDWFVSGESDHCVCSGYFKHGHVEDGRHDLACGAEFWVNPGRTNYLIIRDAHENLEEMKRLALREAEALWGRPLAHDGWYENARFGAAAELAVWTKRD